MYTIEGLCRSVVVLKTAKLPGTFPLKPNFRHQSASAWTVVIYERYYIDRRGRLGRTNWSLTEPCGHDQLDPSLVSLRKDTQLHSATFCFGCLPASRTIHVGHLPKDCATPEEPSQAYRYSSSVNVDNLASARLPANSRLMSAIPTFIDM